MNIHITGFPALLILLALLLVPGFLVRSLALHKGYSGARYFWIGFFLNIFGLVYVGFLPEEAGQYTRKLRGALHSAEELVNAPNDDR